MANKPMNGLKKSTVINPQTIAAALANAPEQLFRAEQKRDEARAVYEFRLAEVSDRAINGPSSYPTNGGSPEGQDKRPASNETQRKIAIDRAVNDDAECRLRRDTFEAAQREVNLCRARQENYQLIARLILAQIK